MDLLRTSLTRGWAWMRCRPWLLWPLAGLAFGAVVVGLLAPVLYIADTIHFGYGSSDDLAIAVFAGIVGVVWGGTGGLIAGVTCLAVTTLARRRGRSTRRLSSVAAGGVTAALVALMGFAQLGDAPSSTGGLLWDLSIWVLVPVAVCATVAYAVGGRIWAWSDRADGGLGVA